MGLQYLILRQTPETAPLQLIGAHGFTEIVAGRTGRSTGPRGPHITSDVVPLGIGPESFKCSEKLFSAQRSSPSFGEIYYDLSAELECVPTQFGAF